MLSQLQADQLLKFGDTLPSVLSPRVSESCSLSNVTITFVHTELTNISPNKPTGLDNIPSRLLKESTGTISLT